MNAALTDIFEYFIEWMSEGSISIMNVERYLKFQKKNTPENTFILFKFHVHKLWKWEKRTKFTANAVLIVLHSFPCFISKNYKNLHILSKYTIIIQPISITNESLRHFWTDMDILTGLLLMIKSIAPCICKNSWSACIYRNEHFKEIL